MKKTALAPTAAVVLRMGEPIYKEPATKKYLALVDTSSGDEMLKKFTTPIHLLNRKFYIRKTLQDILRASPAPMQWVIIAAGVDPMPLEILSLMPDKVARVFEVDVAFMPEKKALYDSIMPDCSQKLCCVTHDITDPKLMNYLSDQHGYAPLAPTIIQMEGITYYIEGQVIQGIIRSFASRAQCNRLIADFLLPYELLTPEGRALGERIFGIINRDTGNPTITHFTAEDFGRFLKPVGGRILAHTTTYDMELLRTGSHAETPTPQDGLIDLIVAEF